jgi:hypothetical protein
VTPSNPIYVYFLFHTGATDWGLFENWTLMGTFGPKRGEVTGRWRKVHNVEVLFT